MVTFATATKNNPSFPTRAPAQRRVDHFVAITCSDPNDSCDLYSDDCRTHAQLVSPSRDPIGYHGMSSLYHSSPFAMDPSGLYEIEFRNGTLKPNPDPNDLNNQKGLYPGIGGFFAGTFIFQNSQFLDKNGCCLCDAVGIVQKARGERTYDGGDYVGGKPWVTIRDPDGGIPYPHTGTNTIGSGVEFPCRNPNGTGGVTFNDEPWASIRMPAYIGWRLIRFSFEATTCLACLDYQNHYAIVPFTVTTVKEELSCVHTKFVITWIPDLNRYISSYESGPTEVKPGNNVKHTN